MQKIPCAVMEAKGLGWPPFHPHNIDLKSLRGLLLVPLQPRRAHLAVARKLSKVLCGILLPWKPAPELRLASEPVESLGLVSPGAVPALPHSTQASFEIRKGYFSWDMGCDKLSAHHFGVTPFWWCHRGPPAPIAPPTDTISIRTYKENIGTPFWWYPSFCTQTGLNNSNISFPVQQATF